MTHTIDNDDDHVGVDDVDDDDDGDDDQFK